MNVVDTSRALAAILETQDKFKGDLSLRAEGVYQAIRALAETNKLPENTVSGLSNAIVKCCAHYSEVEVIGRGENAVRWPTNRFALAALTALGITKPNARAIA